MFSTPSNVSVAGPVTGVAIADFDGDGKLDVAASAGANSVYVLQGDGAGALGSPTALTVGNTPRSIVVGDFNGDAIPDLATANLFSSSASVLLNTTPFVRGAVAWGDNRQGEVGDGASGTIVGSPVPVVNLSRIVSVAAGDQHTVAVLADGTVWAWGAPFNGALGDNYFDLQAIPVQVPGLNTAVAVSAGAQHTLALMADSTVQAWGNNLVGELGVGDTDGHAAPVPIPGLTGVVAVVAAEGQSFVIKADGTAWAFGRNQFGQLGDGTTSQRTSPVQVSGLTGVVAIASGVCHTVAVKADGTVWSWGCNMFGQLGDGTTTDRATPMQVSGVVAAKGVATGVGHSVILKADGTVWNWGSNLHGQLGDGTTTDHFTPMQVPAFGGVTSVGAGQSYTIVLKADGTVWGWGGNSFSGSLGDGTFIERSSPVKVVGISSATAVSTSSGGQHSIAIVPAATITVLIGMVQSMGLAPGTANALLATLNAAQSAVVAGHTNAACAQLGAFTKQVQAFRGRSLPTADADRLLAFAPRVRSGLGCGA